MKHLLGLCKYFLGKNNAPWVGFNGSPTSPKDPAFSWHSKIFPLRFVRVLKGRAIKVMKFRFKLLKTTIVLIALIVGFFVRIPTASSAGPYIYFSVHK